MTLDNALIQEYDLNIHVDPDDARFYNTMQKVKGTGDEVKIPEKLKVEPAPTKAPQKSVLSRLEPVAKQ